MTFYNNRWWVLKHNFRRYVEKFQMWVVWWLPRWVIHGAVVRAWAEGTTKGRYAKMSAAPDGISVSELITRWEGY